MITRRNAILSTLFGSGFVLKTPDGDICIPPDKVSIENPRSSARRFRTNPIDLIIPGDRLYWLHPWGRAVRVSYCGPTGFFRNDAACHRGSEGP